MEKMMNYSGSRIADTDIKPGCGRTAVRYGAGAFKNQSDAGTDNFSAACRDLRKDWEDPSRGTPDLMLFYQGFSLNEAESFARSLADSYLDHAGLNRRREETYLSLRLPAPSNNTPEDVARFLDSPWVKAAHYNRFRGVFVMELSAWVETTDNFYFDQICDYIEENSGDVRFIFLIKGDKDTAQEMYKRLSGIIRLQMVTLERENEDKIRREVERIFEKADMIVSREVLKTLEDALGQLKQMSDYEGVRTAERFAAECVYKQNHTDGMHLVLTRQTVACVLEEWLAEDARKKKENTVVSIRPGFYL